MVVEPTKYNNPKDAGIDVPEIKGANKPQIGITPKAPPMNNALDNPMGDIKPNDPAPWEGNDPKGGGDGNSPASANPAAPADPAKPADPADPTPPVDPNQPGAAAPKEPGSDDPNKPIDPQSALAQKEHWKNKYNRDNVDPKTGKTYKELLEEKEKGTDPAKPDDPKAPTPEQPVETNEEFQEKQNFLWKHKDKDYTPDEFAHIKNVAKSQGRSLDEAAESEQGYIDFQRQKVANEKNIPSPSFPNAPITGNEIPSHEKIEGMDEDTFKKEEERVHKSGQGAGSGGGV